MPHEQLLSHHKLLIHAKNVNMISFGTNAPSSTQQSFADRCMYHMLSLKNSYNSTTNCIMKYINFYRIISITRITRLTGAISKKKYLTDKYSNASVTQKLLVN